MTAAAFEPDPVPIVRDDAGRLMVIGTRVPIDSLIARFKQGKSPESIHQSFDTVPLTDIYAVLAHYLRHRAEVEQYLAERPTRGCRNSGQDRGRVPARRLSCFTPATDAESDPESGTRPELAPAPTEPSLAQ